MAHTIEHRKHISEALKKQFKEGRIVWNKKKKLTKQHIENIKKGLVLTRSFNKKLL